MLNWIVDNYFELAGAFFSLLYIYFSIRQNIWLWPVGLIASGFSVVVFFLSKFYADMGLNVYYVIISVYGWIHWKKGNDPGKKGDLPVTRVRIKSSLMLFFAVIFSFILIGYVLTNYTDSPLPWWDAFTTAGSIVATWMLARKLLEHWLIWIIVDSISAGLYLYKGLYAFCILFLIYTVMAIIGYLQWKKTIQPSK